MKHHKTSTLLIISALASITLFSCSEEKAPSSSEDNVVPTYLKVGGPIKLLDGIKEDFTNGFYDGFDTLEESNWIIGQGYWGEGNGGVSPENVFITDDGQLMLRGLGSYYGKKEITSYGAFKDGRKTGACLISKFGVKPGHYEIKMKVLPRQGACTAFWTYGNRPVEGEENENAEIDVELPGGSKSGKITFKKALNTNWVSEKLSDSVDFSVNEVTPNADYVAYNDNQYHTFGFDWYSDPEMVVYFVDGVISNVSTTFIPMLEGRLWLGVWFPNGFTGASEFEEDYMFVDYVKYTPFIGQEVHSYNALPSINSAPSTYYKDRVREELKGNKISNGDFEYVSKLDETSSLFDEIVKSRGFEYTKLISEKQDQKDVCYPIKNTIHSNGGEYIAFLKDGGVLRQDIDSVYESYKYDFSFDAMVTNLEKEVNATIKYLGNSVTDVIKKDTIKIDSTSFKKYSLQLEAPVGCESIRVEISGAKGVTCYIDNIAMLAK